MLTGKQLRFPLFVDMDKILNRMNTNNSTIAVITVHARKGNKTAQCILSQWQKENELLASIEL